MSKSFRVPCPSCEAEVLIKGENQIGRKTDCPKCKYRFTVPSPDGSEDTGFDVVDAPKKKGNPKALVGILLGVVGVAVLAVGGYMMFGGDAEETPIVKSGGGPRPVLNNDPPKVEPKDKATDKKPEDPKKVEDPKKAGNTSTVPADPTKVGDPSKVNKEPIKIIPPEVFTPVDPSKMKDPTNLLPGQSVSVIRMNMDRLRSTPMYSAFFDKSMLDFFQNTLTFEAADVENVHFCMVDADRDPFVIIRTKKPFSSQMTNKMDLELSTFPMHHQRKLFLIKSNAFVASIGKVFNGDYLLGRDRSLIVDEAKKKAEDAKQMGLHIYDSQTLVIGDLNIVARWLGELDKNGDPPFQTDVAPMNPANPGAPGAPAAPAPGPGEKGRPGGGAPAPQPGAPEGDPKLFDTRTDYRSIRPDLKQILNKAELDQKTQPIILWADIIDQRSLMDKRSMDDLGANDQIWLNIKQIAPSITIAGACLQDFKRDRMIGNLVVKCTSEKDAEDTNKQGFVPIISSLLGFFESVFGTKIDGFTGATPGGNSPAPPGGIRGGRGDGGGGAPQPGGGNPGGGVGIEDFTKSKIEIVNSDVFVTVDADIKIGTDNYNVLIQPYIVSQITQLKGRMAVLSGETSWYSLSSRFPRVIAEKKQFPQGALPRDTKLERFGLPWLPDNRASFIVELLPYLGQGGLRSTIQDKKFAWYDKVNMKAATSWVPQLLVPYYPQSSWRAEHPLARDGNGPVALGATNFVGLSGLGLDSARYNPANPEHAKLVGMTGYEWNSKAAEVTDGLANTIYMIQVPPGFNRPWIAGGGATLMGVDDKSLNPAADFSSPDSTGKRGTYALMADGSVRYIPENVDPKVFKAMVTRAGGEKIDDLDAKLPKLTMPKAIETELKGGKSGGLLDLVMGGGKPNPKDRSKIDAPELQKLQGKWKVSFIFLNGKSLPSGELDKLDMTMDIEDTRMTGHAKGLPDNSDLILMLDPKATPKRIVTQADGKTKSEPGIYALENDGKKLRVRFRTEPKNDTDYPTELQVPQEGSKDGYVELTKIQN